MAKNWDYAAGVVWNRLVASAEANNLATYSDIASAINTNPLSVRLALEPIQRYCIENRLPPLTSIVVGKNNGFPGEGFIAWEVDDLASAHHAVFFHNWKLIQNPYGSFGELDSVSSLADEILRHPTSAETVYAKVKVRGIAQLVFRSALLGAYEGRCAICGTTFRDVLDAAHIKTWGTCSFRERLAISNGLLLCSTHHRMFDAGIMTISLSNKVHYYDPNMRDGPYSKTDEFLSADLHGKNLYLPMNPAHRPARESVLSHHHEMGWEDVP